MSDLLHNFGVNWKLLLAQAVNFFILFFLLRKFAYAPILAMLHKRKREIEHGLEMRDEAAEQLRSADRLKQDTVEQANRQAVTIVSGAEDIAKKRKEEIMAEASQKSEQIVEEAKRLIRQEREKMAEEVQRDAEELVREGLVRVLGAIPPEVRDKQLIQEALGALKTAHQ